MHTTLELPDPLLARLKARAACERVTLNQLLQRYVEQGLEASASTSAVQRRSSASLPRLDGRLAIDADSLSNAALFELLEPLAAQPIYPISMSGWRWFGQSTTTTVRLCSTTHRQPACAVMHRCPSSGLSDGKWLATREF